MPLAAALPEWARLAGLVVVAVGFALRLKPTLVVVIAALLTGLLAGIPLFSESDLSRRIPAVAALTRPGREGLIDTIGRAFVEYRLMTLFILTLPAIALSERFGLQRRAGQLLANHRTATVGRLLTLYQLFRVLMGALSLRVGGHATFVRPLLYPMAVGAVAPPGAEAKDLPEKTVEEIKAASAAAENYGNFYGQNLSPIQPGVLLVFTVLKGLGYTVSLWRLVAFTIPIVVLTLVVGAIQFHFIGRRHRRPQ
jgi:uncharacterized membrane protein